MQHSLRQTVFYIDAKIPGNDIISNARRFYGFNSYTSDVYQFSNQ